VFCNIVVTSVSQFEALAIRPLFITAGLDPAMPLFALASPNSCIESSDGEFVEIIHTTGSPIGLFEPLGHIDFYPNGGKTQNGCSEDYCKSSN
jgi:hypothetical protein